MAPYNGKQDDHYNTLTHSETNAMNNELIRSAEEKVSGAMSYIADREPFYASCLFNLEVQVNRVFAHAATDGRRLWINPDFVHKIEKEVLVSTLIEEVIHCLHLHHVRGVGKNAEDWNIACDLWINSSLKEAGYSIDEIDRMMNGVYNPGLNPKEVDVEEVYRAYVNGKPQDEDGNQPKPQPGQGKDGEGEERDGDQKPDGSGEGDAEKDSDDGDPQEGDGSGDEGENGEEQDGSGSGSGDEEGEGEGDSGSGEGDEGEQEDSGSGEGGGQPKGATYGEVVCTPVNEEEARSEQDRWGEIAMNAARAAQASQGKLPGGMRGLIERLKENRLDLAEVLDRFVARVKSERKSWGRLNRRAMARGMFQPGRTKQKKLRGLVGLDTSGSIGSREFNFNLDCLDTALSAYDVEYVDVLEIDTVVNNAVRYGPDDNINEFVRHGWGGSRMHPFFQVLEGDPTPIHESQREPLEDAEYDFGVLFTDGHVWWGDFDETIPVIIVYTGPGCNTTSCPYDVETVHIPHI